MKNLFLKDVRLYFKDKRAVMFTFLLPMILISIFVFAFGSGGRKNMDPIELLIIDFDETAASSRAQSSLNRLHWLNVRKSSNNPEELVRKGSSVAALIIHEGFEDSVKVRATLPTELLFDGAREMEVGMLGSILKSGLTNYIRSERIKIEQTNKAKHGTVSILPDSKSEIQLKMTPVVGVEKQANIGLIHAVSGTAILMLMFSVSGLGASILQEKESGTLNRLLCSPLRINTILQGKMLFAFFISIIQLVTMFLFAWIVFGLDLFVNIGGTVVMIFSTAFAISSFGIFLAAVSKTRQQAQSFGTLIILVMSALGGSIVPLFIMPAIMKKLAVLSVNYWGIQGFYDIFWRDFTIPELLPRVFTLFLIGTSMSLLSFWIFRRTIHVAS